MHGILLVDKPRGLTSHDVVRKIRQLYRTRKVGHAGTLDPLATGVLVVAVGDGTKILQFLFDDTKSYRATLRLGVATDTFDADGQVLATREVPPLDMDKINAACRPFRGVIEQLPPMYSALKHQGVPLYELARKGQEIERQARQICISRLNVCSYSAPELTIEVDCSKGTYIRSLASDLGDGLGCGAHLTALRRLRSGVFSLENCYTLEQLRQLEQPAAALIPLPEALGAFAVVYPDVAAVQDLGHGIPPQRTSCQLPDGLQPGDLVRLQQDRQLLAVARYQPDRRREKRGDFELIRVFAG